MFLEVRQRCGRSLRLEVRDNGAQCLDVRNRRAGLRKDDADAFSVLGVTHNGPAWLGTIPEARVSLQVHGLI